MQTFPADYKWTGSKTDQEQMVGNAVPVKLAQYVAAAIKRHIEARASKAIASNEFREWLEKNKDLSERTRTDIISRLKRIDKIVGLDKIEDDGFHTHLLQSEDFIKLSSSVKSQMKRSANLLKEYLDDTA